MLGGNVVKERSRLREKQVQRLRGESKRGTFANQKFSLIRGHRWLQCQGTLGPSYSILSSGELGGRADNRLGLRQCLECMGLGLCRL